MFFNNPIGVGLKSLCSVKSLSHNVSEFFGIGLISVSFVSFLGQTLNRYDLKNIIMDRGQNRVHKNILFLEYSKL